MDAVGPEAQHKAVKALIMASRYLQDGHRGQRMAFRAEKVDLPERGPGEPATSMLRLHACMLPELTARATPNVFVSRDTNPGLAAKELADVLKRECVGCMGGMGAFAMSRALKAMVIAGIFMRRSLRGREVAAAMPQLQHLQVHDEERVRFVLTCAVQQWPPEAPNAAGEREATG